MTPRRGARRIAGARLAARLAVLGGAAAALAGAYAQPPDLTLPPRIEPARETAANRAPAARDAPDAPGDAPGDARLADRRDDGPELLEEVIVVSQSQWRLPDLGSDWREAEAAETEPQRIDVAFLPLFDPENRDPYENLFPRHGEIERVGFIELFKVRFGARPAR
jgi:hypothetical protein